ncbi:MAG: glycosyltransferase family 87 protein [Bacteroidota bacterium]
MITPIKDKKPFIYLIPTLLLGIFFIIKYYTAPVGDFGNYYYASHFLKQGNWGLWIYEPYQFNLAIYDLGQRNFFLNYTPVPPLSAVLYLPFTFFSITKAKLIWNSVMLLLFVWSLLRLYNYSKVDVKLLLLIPLFVFVPLQNNIMEGQSYFLLFFLLLEGFIQYAKKNVGLMALCWGLSIHLKISPAFLLFFLFFQKDIKSLSLVIFNIVLLTLISLPLIGFDVWQNYIFKILPRLYNGEINNTYAYNYQSFQVMLKTIFVPDLLHNGNALFDNSLLYSQLLACFKIAVYGLGIVFSMSANSTVQKFSIWLIISLLVSGYGNSFSLILLLIPLFSFSGKWNLTDYRFIIIMGLGALIVNIPIAWFYHLNVFLKFPRFFALLVFFACLLYYSKIKIRLWFLSVLVLPFLLIHKVNANIQNYLFAKEEAILVYGFKVKEGSISFNYFDINGPQEREIEHDNIDAILKEECRQEPIYNKDEKVLKSCSINDSLVFYLSDKNRGVGFYTIRIANAGNE